MGKKENRKGELPTVHTDRNLLDYTVFPRDGYVLPSKLSAHAELLDGTLVDVDVEIVEGRARARRVSVSAGGPVGIGWTTLATVPTRDIVATAVLESLMTASPGDSGALSLAPLGPKVDVDEVRRIVQAAVGYRPSLDRFKRVAS